jgi:hypothetical protein
MPPHGSAVTSTACPASARQLWFHRHPFWASLFLALLGFLAAVLLAELAARLFLPAWAPANRERVRFWKYDELLGWAHQPGQRGRFEHPDFSVDVVINSQGLRDSEYPVERTGKRRMLVLGDSFAWGYGVEHPQRFSEILEGEHPDWEIINAGVSGYGTDQELLFLQKRGLALKPDVVLLLFCPNDFVNNRSGVQYWYSKPYFVLEHGQLELRNVPVPAATLRQRFERWFIGSTYLGARVYSAVNAMLHLPEGLGSHGTNGRPADSDTRELDEPVTYRLLTEMGALCKENGSSLLVVSTPTSTRRRAFLQRLAEREAIPYLPLDAAFSAATDFTFQHDEHWNPKGHEIAAKAIEAFLGEMGVFAEPVAAGRGGESPPGAAAGRH